MTEYQIEVRCENDKWWPNGELHRTIENARTLADRWALSYGRENLRIVPVDTTEQTD